MKTLNNIPVFGVLNEGRLPRHAVMAKKWCKVDKPQISQTYFLPIEDP